MYRITLKKSARKELDGLSDTDFLKVDKAILLLKEKPFPHPQSIQLKGEDKRRLRVGVYRVIYTVDESRKAVTVYRVRHRKDVYR